MKRNEHLAPESTQPDRVPLRPVVQKAFAFWLPLALLFAGLMVRAHGLELDHKRQLVGQTEHTALSLYARNIQSDIHAVMLTLRSLAAYPSVESFLATKDALSEHEVLEVFAALVRAHRAYGQLRILSADGMEVLRLERVGTVVKVAREQELQDKSDRYYYKQIMALRPGRMYLSPLDLNEEHGAVELPFKPMLRFGTPIDTPRGKRIGLILVNYLAQDMLDSLGSARHVAGGAVGMLNRDGYWLKGLEKDSEWGFQLPERAGRTIRADLPDVWKALWDSGATQYADARGLYTILEMSPYPGDDSAMAHAPESWKSDIMFNANRWRLISFAPTPAGDTAFWRSRYFLPSLVVLVALAFSACFLALAYERRKVGLKRIQEQYNLLVLAEGKLRAVMESSHDALVVIDSKGRIEYWNDAAEKMFGYGADEARGRAIHDLLAQTGDREKAQEGLKAFAASGEGQGVGTVREFMARRSDGTLFPVERSLATFIYQGDWHAVGAVRDISERKRAEQRLKELATTDGLTGLSNRRYFMEQAGREVLRARRYGHPLSLLMFDVDHFKKVNDTYGHDGGDEVLREIAAICGRTFRDVDVVGRVGGEEFTVLLPEVGLENAATVAERLRAAMQAAKVESAGRTIEFTISVGVADLAACMANVAEGEEPKSAEALVADFVKVSDTALYQAKRTGRNKVVTAAELAAE